MCGIIGIIGHEEVADRLVDGLRRMEYRGYDSAGVCTVHDGELIRRRAPGKLINLVRELAVNPAPGTLGIAHTRWATHGAPTANNAHPHATEVLALVHNGIIENFRALKEQLTAKGRVFESDTDTEVVAHLLSEAVESGATPEEAVKITLPQLRGAFALAVVFRKCPDMLIGARLGSPLVVGYGDGEMFLGSDALALAPLTQKITYLDEGDWVVLSRQGADIRDKDNNAVSRPVVASGASAVAIEKGNFRHFMQKEIYEQPTVVAQTLRSYVRQVDESVALPQIDFDLSAINRVTIVACGTSYYAGLVAKYWFEQFARLPGTSMSRASSAIAIRCWSRVGWPCSSPSPARRLTPWRRCATARRRGRPSASWSMCRPARWRARPTCCCRPMPGRRSASPRPRRSPASLPCWRRWRRIWRSSAAA